MATETQHMSLLGVSVEIPKPFAEGHVCTAGEAATLNQAFKEAVGNNNRAAVQKELDEQNGEVKKGDDNYNAVLDDDREKKVVAAIREYAAEYKLGSGGAGGRRGPTDPVGKKAHLRATAMIDAKLASAGRPSVATILRSDNEDAKETIKEKIAEIAARPDVVEWAKKEVKREQDQLAKMVDAVDIDI